MLRKLSIVLMLSLTACGSARLVAQTQGGGTFALQGDQGKAMEDAQQQMAAHCGPGNYTIVSQGDVVIGQDTVAQEDTQYGSNQSRNGRRSRGGSSTVAQSSTRDAKEWQVNYACGGAAGGAPPPAGPPGQPAPGPGY